MIYTTSMLTTKAAVEGLVTQAGRAGGSREAPPPAAFVSGRGSGIRASATAGRAERRASAATGGAARVRGQRRVGAPLRLVHRLGGRWAQPLGRPCLRLNAKPPGFCDRPAAAGFGFFAEATTRSRAEEALGTAARRPAKDGVATRIPRAACRPAGASRLPHNGPITHPAPASLAPPRRSHERRHRAPSPPAECQCRSVRAAGGRARQRGRAHVLDRPGGEDGPGADEGAERQHG